MIMKNSIHFLAAVFLTAVISVAAYCQDTHIYYNLYNDSISYVKGGKPVKNLRIRKGQEVKVHLTEFNPFTSNIDLKVEETTDNAGSGLMGAGGMSGMMGMPGFSNLFAGGQGLAGGQGGLPLLNKPLFILNDSSISFKGLKNLFSGSRGQEQLELSNQTMKDIDAIMNDAEAIYNQLGAYEKSVQVSRIALVNVEPLRLNPNIKPSLIKRMCQEYYDAIFRNPQKEGLSLNDLLEWQRMPAQYELNLQRLKSKQSELSAKISLLEAFSKELTSNPMDNESYHKYTRDMIDFQVKARGVRDQFKDITAKAAVPSNLPSTQEMAELQVKLAEVISNDFTYHTTIQPSADQVNLDIKLLKKQLMGADSTEPVLVKERNLKMEVRGGLKVNASAGVHRSGVT